MDNGVTVLFEGIFIVSHLTFSLSRGHSLAGRTLRSAADAPAFVVHLTATVYST